MTRHTMGGKAGYRIGIYVRESRDDYGENYETIETQKELIESYVERNSLGRIVNIYMDDNVSGSGFDRPGIDLLKQDVADGRIDMLILKDLSRLGRNNARTLLFLDFLEEHGIRVLTLDGKYDSTRDNDTVGIETWFNERYLRDLSKKIRMNLRHKIEKGEYIGSAPYGYKKSTVKKNALVIDETKAHIVKEIYNKYLQGEGYAQIAKWLNSMKYPPPSGNLSSGWSAIAVRRILTSRVYIGDTVQGISEKISFKSKKTRRLPEDEWVITRSTHEPIISEEIFCKVQEIRKHRSRTGGHKGNIHPFRHILFCGRCGSFLVARKRKDRPMAYICSNYMKNGLSACSSHHISERQLMEIIGRELLDIFSQGSIIEDVEMVLRQEYFNEQGSKGRLKKLEKELGDKLRQLETIYLDRLEDRISVEFFLQMQNRIKNEIDVIKERIAALQREREIPDVKSLLCAIKDDILCGRLTNDIICLLVNRITVYNHDDSMDALIPLKYPGFENCRKKGAVLLEFSF